MLTIILIVLLVAFVVWLLGGWGARRI